MDVDSMSLKDLRSALKHARKEKMAPVSKMKRGAVLAEYYRLQPVNVGSYMSNAEYEEPVAVTKAKKEASTLHKMRYLAAPSSGASRMEYIGKSKEGDLKMPKLSDVLEQTDQPVEAAASVKAAKSVKKEAAKSAKEQSLEPVEAAESVLVGIKKKPVKTVVKKEMVVGEHIPMLNVPPQFIVPAVMPDSASAVKAKKPVKQAHVKISPSVHVVEEKPVEKKVVVKSQGQKANEYRKFVESHKGSGKKLPEIAAMWQELKKKKM